MSSNNTDKRWYGMYKSFVNYKKRYGHCFVPQSYGTLGRWCDDQRVAFRLFQCGRPSQMTSAKIELLDAESFSWAYENKRDKRWHELYGELLKFKEEHGHCNVPKKYHENQRLGSWVDYQRTLYRQTKKRGQERNVDAISIERIRLLDAVHFRWTTAKGKGPDSTTTTLMNSHEKEGPLRGGGPRTPTAGVSVVRGGGGRSVINNNANVNVNANATIMAAPPRRTLMTMNTNHHHRAAAGGGAGGMPSNTVVTVQHQPPPSRASHVHQQHQGHVHPPPPPANHHHPPPPHSMMEWGRRYTTAAATNNMGSSPLVTTTPQPAPTRIVRQQQQHGGGTQVVRVIQQVANPPPLLPPHVYAQPPVMHMPPAPAPGGGGATIYVVTGPGQAAPPPEVIQQLSGVSHHQQQPVIHRIVYQ